MTVGETVKLIFIIKQLYPDKNGFEKMDKDELRSAAEAWAMVLDDLDFTLAQKALKAHSAHSTFAPSIAELRKEAVNILDPGVKITGDEAWDIVLSAVREYGYGRKQEAIEKMPEAVQPMARRWFDEIGMTENDSLGVTRGQFIKSWEVHADRDQLEKQLPGGISEMIKGLLEKKRLNALPEAET